MPFISEVSGIGAAQFTGSEYTNPLIIQSFLSSLSKMYNLTTSSGTLTATDVKNIQNELNFLTQIAKNGVSINQDPSNPGALTNQPNRTYYMTAQMVGLTDNLFKAIAPNGNASSITLADLNNFRTAGAAATSPISQIFIAAARLYATLPPLNPLVVPVLYSTISNNPTSAVAQLARIFVTGRVFSTATINESMTRSIQSFTELVYIQTANEVINEKLIDLKNALQATKESLDNLNQLQQTHNLITVNSRTFTFALGSTGAGGNIGGSLNLAGYVAKYQRYASSQLKAALVPQLRTEFLPFSLPSTEYTITKATIPPGALPITTNTQWKFTLTLNDPLKYYAFNTSTNAFQPVAASYSLSGYYVPISAGGGGYPAINPAFFTNAQVAKAVGDGFNGVQKFPLLGTLSGMSALKLQLTRQRGALSALLVTLAAQTPASVLADPLKRSQALIGQISAVYGDLKASLGPNPPLNIQIVSGTSNAGAQSGIRAWIMDNYQTFSSPDASRAGLIQQNLTAAITAAQSTNDTQKQDVRNSLLLFEQYYKSAAAILNQLTQIITRMAQGIAK